MLKSKLLKVRSIILASSLLAAGSSLFIVLTHSAFADGGGSVIARAQLRRTVDPSPRSAYGSVLEMIDAHGKETFQVNVTKLGDANYAPVIRDESIPSTDITFVATLAPLARTGVPQGTWTRTYIGTNQAPDDILPFLSGIEASNTLSGLISNEVDISQPEIPLVTTILTNIVGGITNISMGVTNVFGSSTNIINGIEIPNPGQTGEFFSVLWAPLYGLTAKPTNYTGHAKLFAQGDASPKAVGTINISFTGNTGRSQLVIHAMNLTPGQQYTLFVSNSTILTNTVMLPVDMMTQKNLGPTATFVRDTQFGDPLPQQVRDIGDLSGRLVQIRDTFDIVHLQGVMP